MTTLTPAAAPSRPVLGLGGRWARFTLRRTGRLLVSLWALVTASFLMIHFVPGDPVRAALGLTAPADLVAARRESLGLNDPLLTQYLHYLGNLFHGDLGESIQTEISAKFRLEGLAPLLAKSGFGASTTWTDDDGDFALTLATRD